MAGGICKSVVLSLSSHGPVTQRSVSVNGGDQLLVLLPMTGTGTGQSLSIFLNSSVVLLWQVGWIDCLVLAYLGDFLNLDLMFLCLMHLILFFGMANLKSSSAE
jgi:hypothetical protein